MSFYCFNLPFFIIGSQTIFVHCVSVFLFSRIPSSCVLPIFQFLKLLFDHVSSLPMSLFCLPSKSSTIKVCSSHPLKRCHHTHSVHALPVAKRRPSCLHSPHLTSTRPWQLHGTAFLLSSMYPLTLWGRLQSYLFHNVSSSCTGFFNSLNSQYQGIQK